MRYLGVWSMIGIAAVAVALSGCGGSKGEQLAKVGKRTISSQDFEVALNNLPESYKVLTESYKGKRKILANLVKKDLLIQEAERRGYPKDAELKKRIKAAQDETRKKLEKQLEAMQKRMKNIDTQVYENVLLNELNLRLKREGLKGVTITTDQIQTYYDDYARKVKILNPAAKVPELKTVKQQIEAILVEESLLKKLEKDFSVDVKEDRFRELYGGSDQDVTIE